MHKLLSRQLASAGLDVATVPARIGGLIEAVNQAYAQSDDDRALIEHSMDTVSSEMLERYQEIQTVLVEAERVRDELTRAHSLLAATLDATTDGIEVVDMRRRVIQFNRQFVELWRLPQPIVDAADSERIVAHLQGQMVDPVEFARRVAEVYSDPDCETFDVLSLVDGRVIERYSKPQRISSVVVGRVLTFRDVTAQRHLEDQLRQSQKMEAIGSLAGGIAHDFNNMLTVIKGRAEFVLESPGLQAPDRRDIELVVTTANRAAALTHQLLAFSRQQVMRVAALDINAVIEDIEPMLRRLLGEHVTIVTALDPNLEPADADAGQVEQVLLNLAVNARDAMINGGTLTIATSNLELGDGAHEVGAGKIVPGRYVCVSLSDTGVGIAPGDLERVFEPFFTTKGVGKGTGLGLSMVYGILKQSAGYVWVESELGRGTIVRACLPTVRRAPSMPTHRPAERVDE